MYRLSIIISQDFLAPYLDAAEVKMPQQLANVFAGDSGAFQWAGGYSAKKIQIAADLFTGSYSYPLRKLHMEARTLDLIEMQLAEYLNDKVDFTSSTLKPFEVRRIKEAREILVHDMENPPSIAQLAKMTNLGEKKLKTGFKKIFGFPVFEYFRNYRLEMARELLSSGVMNVTEVAMYIGYQSLGHFSHEFSKRYGIVNIP